MPPSISAMAATFASCQFSPRSTCPGAPTSFLATRPCVSWNTPRSFKAKHLCGGQRPRTSFFISEKISPRSRSWRAIRGSISVGEKLPEATLSYLDNEDKVQTISISDLTKAKKVVLFAVPGAFTPTCSQKHLPGFVEKADELRAKGIDTIACISVNDAFVMKAWGQQLNVGDKVLLLADGNGEFTKALGVSLDLSDKPVGLGVRSRRYALLAEDGVVKVLNLEEGGAFTVSSAENILKVL